MGLFGIGIVAVSHRGNVLNGDFFFCPLVSEGFSISMAVLWCCWNRTEDHTHGFLRGSRSLVAHNIIKRTE